MRRPGKMGGYVQMVKRKTKSELAAELLGVIISYTGHDPNLDDVMRLGPRCGFSGYYKAENVVRVPDAHITARIEDAELQHGYHYSYCASNYIGQYFPWPADAWRPTTANLPDLPGVAEVIMEYSSGHLLSYRNMPPAEAVQAIVAKWTSQIGNIAV